MFSRPLLTRSFSSLRQTALYDFHVSLKGECVDFAGWSLPVKYGKSPVLASHLHTRSKASLFDVSHMGQLRIHGADRVKFIESLIVGDVAGLKKGEMRLSVFTNEQGGILDDTIVTAFPDYLGVIVNAGCAEKMIAHIKARLADFPGVSLECLEDQALLALQGPHAHHVIQDLVSLDLEKMNFMKAVNTKVAGLDVTLSRCGYTGEDGFEISVNNSDVVSLAERLLKFSVVSPAGLAVRDTLRLEAGLCLYGHDIDETTTPVEANLSWTIGKRRREEGGFPGHATIMEQLRDGVSRKRVGLKVSGAPAREGASILSPDGKKVGVVTSGTFSPSLRHPIAMGYVQPEFAKAGTPILTEVRGRSSPGVIQKMPFVPAQYYKAK